MKYSIDTSALIGGWYRRFPPDIVPGFWDNLDELIQNGNLKATEEVLVELEKKDDAIHNWVKERENLFILIDEEIQFVVREILSNHKTLIDSRRNRSSADPFVIALAKINSSIVITEESPTQSNNRPHIPDVCDALNIEYINLIDLSRIENWKFH